MHSLSTAMKKLVETYDGLLGFERNVIALVKEQQRKNALVLYEIDP
jgi:hypothetical protein